MARLQAAAAWWCFVRDALTPEAFVRACAEIGYDGIELAEAEHWPLIRDHGLTIASIRGHESLTDGLNRRENHDRIAREIAANIAEAARWGVPNLICFSGNRSGLDDAEGATITAEGLRRVAQMAENAGVTLVLELLNSRVNHPDYQCDRTDWGVAVCAMVGSPAIRLLYDVYHMQIMEGDLIRTIQTHHAHFGHYHIAGNPGRHEPDDTQEIFHPAIFHAIRATGYTGYVGAEFIPTGDPIAALRAAHTLFTDAS